MLAAASKLAANVNEELIAHRASRATATFVTPHIAIDLHSDAGPREQAPFAANGVGGLPAEGNVGVVLDRVGSALTRRSVATRCGSRLQTVPCFAVCAFPNGIGEVAAPRSGCPEAVGDHTFSAVPLNNELGVARAPVRFGSR